MKHTTTNYNKVSEPFKNDLLIETGAKTLSKESKLLIPSINHALALEILPDYLEKVLIGLMLGDGSIYRSSLTSNSRFEMSFGQTYKEYAESIGKLFINYASESSISTIKTVKLKVKDKVYINYRFKTASLSLFNKYHSFFYKIQEYNNTEYNNTSNIKPTLRFIKVIPDNIVEILDPVVLAYLIMSDGNFDKGRNRVRIYTNSFKKQEVEMLAHAINTKFGIYTAILHDRKDQWIITIGAKELSSLRYLVSQYFHPSMLYRLGL